MRESGTLVLLAALWGASFLFIRIASPVLGPLVLVDLRVLTAGLVLVGVAAVRRRRLDLGALWRAYLRLGANNAAIPFALVAVAALRLPASMLATLNAAIPLFTALVAAVWLGERLTGRKVGGLLLGIVGVGLLVGWSPIPLDLESAAAVGCSLLASLMYGIGGVYTKRRFGGVPALELATGQQLAAAALLAPLALLTVPPSAPTGAAIVATLGLAVPSTAFAYVLYFRLIGRVGPTRTMTVTFLIPGFGLLWGALLLGEPITAGMLAGLAIILASVALVVGRPVALPSTSEEPTERRSAPTG